MEERHRHRYEVNPTYIKDLEAQGMQFVGHSTDGQRMEIMELAGEQTPPHPLLTPGDCAIADCYLYVLLGNVVCWLLPVFGV